MKVDQIFHMVGGQGETSYAANSTLQERAISRAKSIVQRSAIEVYCTLQPEILTIADLGCSSGHASFMAISEIMEAVHETCYDLSYKLPEFMFFLNDLPGNDFNTVFKLLTKYKKKVQEKIGSEDVPFYVAGVPGSFYGRLFPKESVHFVHSSFSLHWLSQMPHGLRDDSGMPVNRRNIYISETSPPSVLHSYLVLFQQDFSTFLKLRSKEIVYGGQLVITIIGRSNQNPLSGGINYYFSLLADALNSFVEEGVLQKEKVDAFDVPFYAPAIEEVKAIVKNEGSFEFHHIETFECNWHSYDECMDDFVLDNFKCGESTAKQARAVMEPMLASYFGDVIMANMDALFSIYALNVAKHLKEQKTKFFDFTFVLKKVDDQ